jgi:hypothetical protein
VNQFRKQQHVGVFAQQRPARDKRKTLLPDMG